MAAALLLTLSLAADPAVDRFGDPLPPHAVARLGTLRYRCDRPLSHPVVLPGGREVAFAVEEAVVVMDLDTGRTLRRIIRPVPPRGGVYAVAALALAPDGRTLAVGCQGLMADNQTPLAFWLADVATGRPVREFAGRDIAVVAVAFLAGGRQVAALDGHSGLGVWDVSTGARVHDLTVPGRSELSLAASPDGTTLVAGGAAKDGAAVVYLWDAVTGRSRDPLAGHTADVRAVAFSPDGRTLATGGATVRLWDVASGRELRRLDGHDRKHFVRSLAFSADGRLVASASTDGTVRTWEAATGRPIDDVAVTVSEGHAVAFRDGRTLVLGSGYRLLLRDTAGHAFTNDYGSRYDMFFVQFAADGRRIVSGDGDGAVRTWDAADGRLRSTTTWGPLSTNCPMVAPGGEWVAFAKGDPDRAVTCIGDVATGKVVRRLPDDNQIPASLSAGSGRRLATLRTSSDGAKNKLLTVWDATTGVPLNRLNIGPVLQAVAFGADGRSVFTAEREQTYRLRRWDVATGRVLTEYPLPENKVARSFAVSPGGRRLAVICEIGPPRVFDTVTGRQCWPVNEVDGHVHNETGVAFSPDGSWLATESFGGGFEKLAPGFYINLRDARTGATAATLRGHTTNLGQMAFSPDSRRLVSTGTDGTALVWDVEAATGRRVVAADDPARQAELWADLAGDDGLAAHAIDCLQTSPTADIALFKERLRPPAAVPADRVGPLVAALDGPSFAAREQAQRDLAALGPGAEPGVRAARDKVGAEGRRRIDAVLAGWHGEARRAERAIEVLEYVATPDARTLLESLAAGDPADRLTRAAKAARDRLR